MYNYYTLYFILLSLFTIHSRCIIDDEFNFRSIIYTYHNIISEHIKILKKSKFTTTYYMCIENRNLTIYNIYLGVYV